jgi:hypothetical protein
MNERIRLLAELAGYTDAYYESDDGAFVPAEFDKEKFAELIVKECIETLRLVPYNSDREFGDEVIYQEAIVKHFGVEE